MTNLEYYKKRYKEDIYILNKDCNIYVYELAKLPMMMGHLSGIHETLGFLEIILKNDYKKSINYFYKAALMRIIHAQKLPTPLVEKPLYITTFSNGILSNSPLIINLLQDEVLLHTRVNMIEKYDNPSKYKIYPSLDIIHQYDKCFQSILSGNKEALNTSFKSFMDYRNTKKVRWDRSASREVELFEGYLEDNVVKIQSSLESYYRNLKKSDSSHMVYNLICTSLAKLAILRGYDIDFDVPEVPQALLRTDPLDKYESYEWLDVLHEQGYEAYVEKYVKPNAAKNKDNDKGFFGKLFGKN